MKFVGWESRRTTDKREQERSNKRDSHPEPAREISFCGGGWRGVEKEGEERLASLKSPNPLTSVAGAKMEDHTAF